MTTLSSVCLHHTTGLKLKGLLSIPGPEYALVSTLSVELTLVTALLSSGLLPFICKVSPFLTVSNISLKATSTPL